MSRYRGSAILAALLILLGVVGHLDYQAAEEDREQYCEMVKAKLWPDFRGTYQKECRK